MPRSLRTEKEGSEAIELGTGSKESGYKKYFSEYRMFKLNSLFFFLFFYKIYLIFNKIFAKFCKIFGEKKNREKQVGRYVIKLGIKTSNLKKIVISS